MRFDSDYPVVLDDHNMLKPDLGKPGMAVKMPTQNGASQYVFRHPTQPKWIYL